MLIEFDNVKKVYRLGKTKVYALNGISLKISEKEFTVIAGPSGSGKTTLLNIMGLLDKPTDGTVLFEQKDVNLLSDFESTNIRRHRVGFIFQTFNLIPVLTAFENVEIPLILRSIKIQKRKEMVKETMESIGLKNVMMHRPDELSGGERQRVAIARALVGKPDIVFADEPTANLDSETGFQIIDVMKKMNITHSITFVFSTHDDRIVKMADRKIELIDGKIAYDSI